MRRVVLSLLLLPVVAVGASAAGGGVGVGSAGLQAVASAIEPELVAKIRALTLPDIRTEKSGFKIHLFNMHMGEFDCATPCIKPFFGSGGQVGIQLPGFHFKFHLHARFTKLFVTLGTVCNSALGPASLSASGKLVANKDELSLTSVSASANVGHFQPNCNGIAGSFINIISGLFDSTIKHEIDSTLQQQITGVLTGEVAKILTSIKWKFPLEKGVASVDFSPQAVEGGKEHLSLTLKAAVTDPQGDMPPTPSPTIPAWSPDAGHAYLQVVLSSWSLSTYAYTYWRAGRLTDHITHEDIGSYSPIQLNTSSIGLFAPGLRAKYPDHWMSIDAVVTAAPLCDAQKSGVSVRAAATFAFHVVNSSGGIIDTVFTLGTNATAGVTFGIVSRANASGQALTAKITNASAPLSVFQSDVGTVRIAGISKLTNSIVDRLLVPLANALLGHGLPLPSTPVLQLENTTIRPDDGYLLVATQFKVGPLG